MFRSLCNRHLRYNPLLCKLVFLHFWFLCSYDRLLLKVPFFYKDILYKCSNILFLRLLYKLEILLFFLNQKHGYDSFHSLPGYRLLFHLHCLSKNVLTPDFGDLAQLLFLNSYYIYGGECHHFHKLVHRFLSGYTSKLLNRFCFCGCRTGWLCSYCSRIPCMSMLCITSISNTRCRFIFIIFPTMA